MVSGRSSSDIHDLAARMMSILLQLARREVEAPQALQCVFSSESHPPPVQRVEDALVRLVLGFVGPPVARGAAVASAPDG